MIVPSAPEDPALWSSESLVLSRASDTVTAIAVSLSHTSACSLECSLVILKASEVLANLSTHGILIVTVVLS